MAAPTPSNASAAVPPPVICASFNQDYSGFAIGTKDGFKIFDAKTGNLCFQMSFGTFSIVEMLFSTNLLAIVGAGEQPSLSPRRLHIYNTRTGKTIRELNFLTSILAVRLNKQRLIVVLQDKTYIYDSNSVAILDTIDTVPNTTGLCAFAPNSESCYLALPASKTKGTVVIINTLEIYSLCQIDAHHNPLAAIAFSSNGTCIATASEHGTVVRVHLVLKPTESYSFRRGTYASTIYSLSFGSSKDLPDILLATSSSGTIHAFLLGSMINQQKSGGVIGSIIPSLISNALESSYHHILHKAVPPGIKSYSVVQSVDNLAKVDKTSTAATFCASILVIHQGGYLKEYSFCVNRMNESSWNLEREVNLVASAEESPFLFENVS